MALPANLNMITQLVRLCRKQDAEIERLRAALKPFADLGYNGVPNQGWIDEAHRIYYGRSS